MKVYDASGIEKVNAGAGGAADGVNIIAAGTQTANTTGTVVFSDLNNISFGMNNSSIVTAAASLALFATSNTTYNSTANLNINSVLFAGAGIASVGYSNGSVVVSVPAGGGAADGVNIIAAGTQTANTTGTVVFSDLNNISFGMNNSSVVTASFSTLPETPFGISAGTQSVSTGTVVFSRSHGVSFLMSGSSRVVASILFMDTNGISFGTSGAVQSITASADYVRSISAGTTNATGNQIVFSNGSNVSFGANGATITASVLAQTVQTQSIIQAMYDGANSITTGTVRLTNANGVSFSINGQTLSASVAAQTNQAMGIVVSSNTTGNTSSATYDARSFTIVGAGVASVGLSTVAGSTSLYISVPAGGGAADGVNIIAAGTRTATTSGTVLFSDANGISWGLNAVDGSIVTASHNGITSQSNQTLGLYASANTTGNTSQSSYTATALTLVFTGNISGGWSTNDSKFYISAPTTAPMVYYEPIVRGLTLTASLPGGTVFFQPFFLEGPLTLNRMHFLQQVTTQATTTFSVTAQMSGGAQQSTDGNGSFGQSGTVMLFSRVSTGTNANSSRIISFYSNSYSNSIGHTVSATWSTNVGGGTASCTLSWTTRASIGYVSQIGSDGAVTTTVSSSSGSSTLTSTSTTTGTYSQQYTGSFASLHMSQIRPIIVPFATSLSAGEYWLAHIQSTNTGSTNYSLNRICRVNGSLIVYTSNTTANLAIGNSASFNSNIVMPGWGSYSSSGNTSTTIALSDISNNSQNQTWFNMMYLTY